MDFHVVALGNNRRYNANISTPTGALVIVLAELYVWLLEIRTVNS